jgi:hypothetical protein
MKKTDPSVVYEPVREFIEKHKGQRLILDWGHRAIIGDGRSNTIILTADGKAVCHECGY